MSKPSTTPPRRLTCTDVRFVEVDFPRQVRPRLVIELSGGIPLLPEDYLVEVINRLPHDTTPEQAAALTPARIAAERRAQAEESPKSPDPSAPRRLSRPNTGG